MRDARILMAGCGRLGQRIGAALAEHHQVFGLRRQASRVPLPLTPIQGDLLDPDSLGERVPEVDVAIICLTPDQYDETGYHRTFVQGTSNLMTVLEAASRPPRRVFFISSTAVYGQHQGEWVDEASPTEPPRYNGSALLTAEQRLGESPIAGTVVRFSGIYGNDRDGMLSRMRDGSIAPEPDSGYTNRIHEDDAVGALCHLVNRTLDGDDLADCYLASDCEPARLGDVVAWVRETMSCDPVRPDARRDSRVGSKRVDSSRLREAGYRFLFPTFREGYASMTGHPVP